MADSACPYVSRGGLKLAAALDAFSIDVTGFACADLGANVGGFSDCLLKRGAVKVYAVDTAYGQLAWTLRQDEHVVVMERTNALHVEPVERVDLVTVDLGWTRQSRAVPAALGWSDQLITLIKPHYEADKKVMAEHATKGVLDEEAAADVAERVISELPQLGVTVIDHIRSPIHGGGGKGRRGNVEYLALLKKT